MADPTPRPASSSEIGEALLPCPFCGTTDLTVCTNAVECDDCHAQIIDDELDEPPIAAWNTRAAIAQRPAPADGLWPLDKRCADALADEVAVLVKRGVIDSRSPAADALLDYRNPPSSPRADRLAALLPPPPECEGGQAVADANVSAVIRKHAEREAAGLRKYGVSTTRGDLSRDDWLRHLQEELMDAAVYIEAALSNPPTDPVRREATSTSPATPPAPDDAP